jgi:cell division septal protein FtsQ
MKLKPQPRAPRRQPRRHRRGASRIGARPRGRQARRPGVSLRRRLDRRLPSIHRLLAVVATIAAVAGLVALLNGPWLRVRETGWEGGTYTRAADVEEVLAAARGRSVLTVDTRLLRDRLEGLPSVADAEVTASLTGAVQASLVEPEATMIWQTRVGRLLVAADGMLFGALPADAELPADLASLPTVTDERAVAGRLSVGDRIGSAVLETTMRVVAIDPAALGSKSSGLAVRLDDELGFRLTSDEAGWEVALGVYGTDPRETSAEAAARLDRQVTAVRTLFASRREADIGWVDVRNPGKVYFRAKG